MANRLTDIDLEKFLNVRENDRISFFCYRLPNEDDVVFSAGKAVEGIKEGAFIVAPFMVQTEPVESIVPSSDPSDPSDPSDNSDNSDPSDSSDLSDNSDYSEPSGLRSTPREDHRRGVGNIREALREHGGGKCVLSRVIVRERRHSLADDFRTLCEQRPDALVFLFRTPKAGMWIGASPELLLAAESGKFETMSLAGTRPAGTKEDWDAKNIEEQRLVTDFIADTFRLHGLRPEIGPLHTRSAGPVEHLCTRITAPFNIQHSTFNIQHSTFNILKDLSPTPALCGSPRELALRLIAENEAHHRGHYGGFLGSFRSAASFRLFVNLRSALLLPEEYVQFVGGGITRFSDPDSEWLETERKAATLPPL